MTLVRRPLMLLAPAALLVVALALATNVLPLRQIVAQQQEIAATQSRLDSLVAENDRLDDRVDALGTPIEIERIARDDLGYIRPGETAYVVVDPSVEEGDSAAATEGEIAEPATADDGGPTISANGDGNFATRIWDFLTGRDLAGSG